MDGFTGDATKGTSFDCKPSEFFSFNKNLEKNILIPFFLKFPINISVFDKFS